MLGRVGCMLHGCCLGRVCEASWFTVNDAHGIARWPAAQAEFLFNLLALLAVLVLRWRRILPNQHFHLYLIAYGLFRFAHEFRRDTPQAFGQLSGYQIAALLLVALGGVGFWRRAQSRVKSATEF